MSQRKFGTLVVILLLFGESEQGCGPPTDFTGGYFEPYRADYDYGTELNYYCSYGYERAGGSFSRQCGGFPAINAYYWTGQAPECALIDCGQPSIENADYDVPAVTTYLTSVQYRCKEGWAPMEPQLAECTINGTWEFSGCQEPEFHCPAPPVVSNARHNVSDIRQQHGTTVQYQCENGYNMEGSEATIFCQKTNWVGTLPTCSAVIIAAKTSVPPEDDSPSLLSKNALPILAGVVTAVLLVAILIITVLCLRKRLRKPQHSNPESVISTSPAATSTPQLHGSLRAQAPASTFHKEQTTEPTLTLPYHRIQCPHIHSNPDFVKCDQNYVPDSSLTHFKPLVANSDHVQSSSPSTVQSDVSVTDSEFHTIRECLGDFRNNNLPTPHNIPNPQPPLQQNHTLQHPFSHSHILQPMVHHSMTTPRIRTLWTPDGRPYEAVTCPHGVEHIYQPLEHIYEEPHIWMRPLPNPQP